MDSGFDNLIGKRRLREHIPRILGELGSLVVFGSLVLGWLCMSYSVFGDPVFCALLGTMMLVRYVKMKESCCLERSYNGCWDDVSRRMEAHVDSRTFPR